MKLRQMKKNFSKYWGGCKVIGYWRMDIPDTQNILPIYTNLCAVKVSHFDKTEGAIPRIHVPYRLLKQRYQTV